METMILTDKDIKVYASDKDRDRYIKMFAGVYRLTNTFVFDNVKVLDFDMKDNTYIMSELQLELEAFDRAVPLPEWYIHEMFEIASFMVDDRLYAIAYDGLDEQIVLDEHRKIADNLYVFERATPLVQLQEMHFNVYRDDAQVEINIDCDDMIIDIGDTIKLITIKSSESRVVMNVYEKIQ